MPRLADETVNRIKQEIKLTDLLKAQGHTLHKHGQQFAVACPWHDDKTPSLVISPDTNLWHCKACDIGGSNIDWQMRTQNISFRSACDQLMPETKDESLSSLVADDPKLMTQVIDYYQSTLKQSPEAMEYLSSRGLNHPALIDTFKLGYANRTLGYRLPNKTHKTGEEVRKQLQSLGILRKTGHEHFNGCLVVPIIEEEQVKEVYGRKLQSGRGSNHLYLPGAHKGIWNSAALTASKDIILCEALIDAMTFWVHDLRHVTASYGTSGFTKDHLEAFRKHKTEKVYIAYDNDDAGNQAACKLAETLFAEGIDCYRVYFPHGLDANAFAQRSQNPKADLTAAIEQAEWMKELAPSKPIKTQAPEEEPSNDNPQETPKGLFFQFDDRRWRIRGWEKLKDATRLPISLMLESGLDMHLDHIDLSQSKHRAGFIKQAAIEVKRTEAVLKQDIARILRALEEKIENQNKPVETPVKVATDAEKEKALSLLKDPQLIQRILDDFNLMGVVGEETNKLVGYLACVSRKLEKPLAVLIQSTSAAGKTSLMDAVLSLVPPDDRQQYSALTPQALYYMGELGLQHKILAISEEEGASNASYALKLLQSEGELKIAYTVKDESTGKPTAQTSTVQGPTMLFLTTTAIDIDEELLNRCLVLTVNETREQTQAIHKMQRRKRSLNGLKDKLTQQSLMEQHHLAQQMLRPLKIINPYAEQLTFLDTKTRTRRDHEKYLTLIDSIALLHQYQRPIKQIEHDNEIVEYIEVTPEDIQQANQLAHEVLGRTLDELPPQTRKLLQMISKMVAEQCEHQQIERSQLHFSRRDIRAYTYWSDSQLKTHCKRLEELEYLLPHKGGRGQSIEYELLYDHKTEPDISQFMGLLNTQKLCVRA